MRGPFTFVCLCQLFGSFQVAGKGSLVTASGLSRYGLSKNKHDIFLTRQDVGDGYRVMLMLINSFIYSP